MTNSTITSSDRNTIITRFVIVYIISICCAIIPLFYLFNLPDKAISEIKVSKLSAKGQQERLERIFGIYDSLDKSLSEKNLKTGFFFARLLSEYENIDKEEFNKPLFDKIADLYQQINKINESDLKVKYSRLKVDSLNLINQIQQLQQELKSCNDIKNVLMLK